MVQFRLIRLNGHIPLDILYKRYKMIIVKRLKRGLSYENQQETNIPSLGNLQRKELEVKFRSSEGIYNYLINKGGELIGTMTRGHSKLS